MRDATQVLPILDPVTLEPITAPASPVPELPPRLADRHIDTVRLAGHAVAIYDHGPDDVWLEISLDGTGAWQTLGAIREARTIEARIHVNTIRDRAGHLVIKDRSAEAEQLRDRVRYLLGRRGGRR